MRPLLSGAFWVLAYVGVLSLPLFVLLARPASGGQGFWWDLSMGLGIGGLAVVGAQSLLTARFRRASSPFGVDILYYFHRWMALGALLLLGAHWGILRWTSPEALAPALPGRAPWGMTSARAALGLLTVLVATSLWRKPLRLEYDRWRATHAILAVLAVGLAALHVRAAGNYTRAPVERTVWVAYAALWAAMVGYTRALRPLRLLARPWRVAGVRPAPGRSWTVTIEPEGHAGIRFRPGQFAWLTLRRSPFAAREHPFSFSGSAASGPAVEFTIRELGDFTRTIGQIRAGETAYVDGPYGAFTVDRWPAAPGFVFVAGGVGIAPIMSMLRTLADRGDPRPLRLVYANDRWEDVLFREELDELAARTDLTVEHVLVAPPPGWAGARGYVTEGVLRRAASVDPARLVYFLCGPKPMNEAVLDALRGMGVPLHRIHFELFDMA